LKFSLHREFPESLKTEWNALLGQGISHVPFLRYEYLNTWWHTRGGGEWPQAELAIISAEEDGKLIGIAPFFLADHEGKRRLLFLGSIEISDFLDLIVRDDDAARFSTELVSFLLNTEELSWQAVDLYNILEGSVSLKSLEDAASLLKENCIYYSEDLMWMPLPCFQYYILAYTNYLLSESSHGDADGASCFFGLVECRKEDIRGSSELVIGEIARALEKLKGGQGWYGATEEIDGSFQDRALSCLKLIGAELRAAPNGGPATRRDNSGVRERPPSVSWSFAFASTASQTEVL